MTNQIHDCCMTSLRRRKSCDIHCLAHHFCVATSGMAAKNPRVIVYSSSFIRLVYTRKDDVKRAGAWAPLSLVSLARPSRGERGSGCEAHASQTLSSHRRVSTRLLAIFSNGPDACDGLMT